MELNTYRVREKESGEEIAVITGLDEAAAWTNLARREGFASVAQWAQSKGVSEAAMRSLLTMECISTAQDYIDDCIHDELRLAVAMGYTDLDCPPQPHAGSYISGVARGQRMSEALPRWRRDASCMGPLLEALPMSIRRFDEGVNVWIDSEAGTVHATAKWADHETPGMAIRKAMTVCAADYLTMGKQA